METGSKVWFTRHACSMLNLWRKLKSGKVKESEICPTESAFFKSTKDNFDINIIDAPLCELGRSQAKESQNLMMKIPIKYIICSPLERTLETAKILFENHPNKNKIEVIVNPMIRECLTCPDDIPKWTLKRLPGIYESYNEMKFNFSMMNSMHPGLWFFDSVDPELKEVVMKEIKVVGEDKYPEILIKLINEKKKTGPKYHYIESYQNCRKRAKIFLDWLKELIKEKELKPNEVIVVSHMTFLQCLAAKRFDDQGIPDYPSVNNVQPFEIDIDDLLKFY